MSVNRFPLCVPNFSEQILQELHKQRLKERLIDVEFTTNDHKKIVSAHRLVLTAKSEYFREHFLNAGLFFKHTDKPVQICVPDFDGDAFELLVNYCYTGSIDVQEQNVAKLLKAAVILKMQDVVDACWDFIRTEMLQNNNRWLEVLKLVSDVGLQQLAVDVLRYATLNFMQLSCRAEFLSLNIAQLMQIIESDELDAPTEQEIFHAIKRWYEHNEVLRVQYLPQLVKTLRLTQLDTSFLLEHIHPLPGCGDLALEALQWKHVPAKRAHITLPYKYARSTLIALPLENNAILKYDTAKRVWQNCGEIFLQTTRFHVAHIYPTYFIFLGGESILTKKFSNAVGRYDLKTQSWLDLTPMHKCRACMCVAQLRRNIYAIGGYDNTRTALNSVERFDVDSNEWCMVSSMFKSRYSAAAVVVGDEIYVMGGKSSSAQEILCSTECYDTVKNNWRQCANMQETRMAHGAAVANGYIYVVGGINQHGVLRSVERYDPVLDKWIMICPLNWKRSYINVVFFNNRLMALGGTRMKDTLKYTSAVEAYNEEHSFWQNVTPLPIKTMCHCIVMPTSTANQMRNITERFEDAEIEIKAKMFTAAKSK